MSVSFSIEIDIEGFCGRVGKLDHATQDNVQDALVQAANAIMLRARQLAPVRTGQLMQSIYAIGAGQQLYRLLSPPPFLRSSGETRMSNCCKE